MSGREDAPGAAPQPDPADANTSDLTNPEQLANDAAKRLEAVFEAIVGGETGVRSVFDRVGQSERRPQDGETPALYVDRIGTVAGHAGVDVPITAIEANRPETVPAPYIPSSSRTLDRADVTLDFGGHLNDSLRPSAGPEARTHMTRFARVVTKNEAGESLYEDVAFMAVGDLTESEQENGRFRVRRNRLDGSDNPEYSQEVHTDVEAFTRITTEATDIVLAAAKARSEKAQAETAAAHVLGPLEIAQASQVLETL
ncbi:MAG TPA: hypothetical protein VFC50_02590 [Candidatus Dormibacteraeota bacterium]|nr:hypothetical protein [Candidatus Dormibacteraeota bacterium]